MLEAFVLVTATTGLFALAKGIRGNQRFLMSPGLTTSPKDQRGDDLPCPWCYGPTDERDARCTGCGRAFG